MPIFLNYYFWLVSISLVFLVLERIRPWRTKQDAIRKDLVQDLFWLVFNQQYIGWLAAIGVVKLLSLCDSGMIQIGLPAFSEFNLISNWPILLQVILAFILKDLIDWNVHRLMHLVPWMWELHKLHHSIVEMDWLGAFRAHWGELLIYRIVGFIPLIVLGVDNHALFIISITGLVIQEVSHSNLNLDWGFFRYVFNSPRFHAWHHDVKMYGKGGQNFAVNLTVWDKLFRTQYWPEDVEQPEKFGFRGIKKYPRSLLGRLLHPFIRLRK